MKFDDALQLLKEIGVEVILPSRYQESPHKYSVFKIRKSLYVQVSAGNGDITLHTKDGSKNISWISNPFNLSEEEIFLVGVDTKPATPVKVLAPAEMHIDLLFSQLARGMHASEPSP